MKKILQGVQHFRGLRAHDGRTLCFEFCAQQKSQVTFYSGNPAISKRPVAFRPPLTKGLALSISFFGVGKLPFSVLQERQFPQSIHQDSFPLDPDGVISNGEQVGNSISVCLSAIIAKEIRKKKYPKTRGSEGITLLVVRIFLSYGTSSMDQKPYIALRP
jgi:hypothetical protein